MTAWRMAGVAAGVVVAVAMRWTTAIPLGTRIAGDQAAQLRLSLSARPERVERCRELSDDELAKLPAHMRLRTTCAGYSARYELLIAVDGRRLVVDTLRGGGLRHDRPLHVFREFDVSSGGRHLLVNVTRVDEGDTRVGRDTAGVVRDASVDTLLGGRAERERDERARRTAEAMPPRLVLDTLMAIAARRVVLITFDRDARRLTAQTRP